jgi:hypothetical protein
MTAASFAHVDCLKRFGLEGELKGLNAITKQSFIDGVLASISAQVTEVISNTIENTVVDTDLQAYKKQIEGAIWRELGKIMPARSLTAAASNDLTMLINSKVKEPVSAESLQQTLWPSSTAN